MESLLSKLFLRVPQKQHSLIAGKIRKVVYEGRNTIFKYDLNRAGARFLSLWIA